MIFNCIWFPTLYRVHLNSSCFEIFNLHTCKIFILISSLTQIFKIVMYWIRGLSISVNNCFFLRYGILFELINYFINNFLSWTLLLIILCAVSTVGCEGLKYPLETKQCQSHIYSFWGALFHLSIIIIIYPRLLTIFVILLFVPIKGKITRLKSHISCINKALFKLN